MDIILPKFTVRYLAYSLLFVIGMRSMMFGVILEAVIKRLSITTIFYLILLFRLRYPKLNLRSAYHIEIYYYETIVAHNSHLHQGGNKAHSAVRSNRPPGPPSSPTVCFVVNVFAYDLYKQIQHNNRNENGRHSHPDPRPLRRPD